MRLKLKKAIQLITIIVIGIFMVATVVVFARKSADRVLASGPIKPPIGYPKLSLSTKEVTPTLAKTDGAKLEYYLKIINTGAFTATDVTLVDTIPNHTTYNGDVKSSAPTKPKFANGAITWEKGKVGFDDTVLITFSVSVATGYEGIISNTAVIRDPMIAKPVTVTAETRVTDYPMFEIAKTSSPELPGANKPLNYDLVVTNMGQAAVNTPIIVTDFLPENTTFRSASPGGYSDGNVVTWKQNVDMGFGATTPFTFSVNVGDVTSGTVIENKTYSVVDPDHGTVGIGEPVTTTVVDPIFLLSKGVFPDPPGANSEMTYTLTVLNLGSKATYLVITDTVPANIEYVRGGTYTASNRTVSWDLPSLDTRETAQVTFTVKIADIANVTILNGKYRVCSAEKVGGVNVCAWGTPVPTLIVGPTFAVEAVWDPLVAHKPGGGTADVTPTITIENLGPGNALDALARLTFGNVSLSTVDPFVLIPSPGKPPGKLTLGPPCVKWNKCSNFVWTGNLGVGDVITITTSEGQSTIGGAEWTPYTATVVVTDSLSGYVTEPITGTAIGHVTHHAHLIPTKFAPAEIGPGRPMTYTIQVFDSGLSTDVPPYPQLTETVPPSLTVLSVSDGGITKTIGGNTVISWTLPAMGPGDLFLRTFRVLVDPDLVSGTLIINDDYRTTWHENGIGMMSILGEPVTTTVHEVGLIDSSKTVTPTWALPDTGTVLTYVVHVANTSPDYLSGVEVNDIFPWQNTTYQRDAEVTSGSLISDIVSLEWKGDVGPYSEQLITFTVMVDDYFEGVLTNTATISHSSLKQDVVATAVAYITDKPVLRISKIDSPDPVMVGNPLLYTIHVADLAQQATRLVVTDTIPVNTTYISGTASSGGQLVDGLLRWEFPVINATSRLNLTFQVKVIGGYEIINDKYAVRCQEGAFDYGDPVITKVWYRHDKVMLPVIFK